MSPHNGLPVVHPVGPRVESDAWRDEAAEGTVILAVARAHAISRLPDVPDEVFVAVRAVLISTMVSYSHEWRELSRTPHVGSWYEEPTVDRLVNDACGNVLSILGLLLQGGRPVVLPSGEYPARSGDLHVVVTVE